MESPWRSSADLGCTFLVSIAAAIALSVRCVSSERAAAQCQADLMASQLLLLVDGLTGTICTILGGYIAASLGRVERVRRATWMGVVALLLGLLWLPMLVEAAPIWYTVASYMIMLPAAVLGGTLREAQEEPGSLRRAGSLAALVVVILLGAGVAAMVLPAKAPKRPAAPHHPGALAPP